MKYVFIASLIIFEGCTFSKTKNMNSTENTNFSCDVEIGICSSSENINAETKLIMNKEEKMKSKLIYYYDALCGWCYGFSSVMSSLEIEYKNKVDFQVISGGLFLGDRKGFVNDVAPHIKAGAYKSVESVTGVKFGEPFLSDVFGEGKMTLNSLPPSIALCIVREKFPDKELEFAKLLLSAVYYEGMNPIIVEEYRKFVIQIGFDFDEFTEKMRNDKYKKMAEDEFEVFRNSQFSGMPALVLEKDNKQVLLSNGYASYSQLKNKIDQLLE